MPPEYCPNCGAAVPRQARACPECGACEQTGWSERAATSGLGLPDEEFDYDEFVGREFGGKSPKKRRLSWFWKVVAAVLLVLFLKMMFGPRGWG
jgi:hypothetical protein